MACVLWLLVWYKDVSSNRPCSYVVPSGKAKKIHFLSKGREKWHVKQNLKFLGCPLQAGEAWHCHEKLSLRMSWETLTLHVTDMKFWLCCESLLIFLGVPKCLRPHGCGFQGDRQFLGKTFPLWNGARRHCRPPDFLVYFSFIQSSTTVLVSVSLVFELVCVCLSCSRHACLFLYFCYLSLAAHA